jgi:hypothetical protein
VIPILEASAKNSRTPLSLLPMDTQSDECAVPHARSNVSKSTFCVAPSPYSYS